MIILNYLRVFLIKLSLDKLEIEGTLFIKIFKSHSRKSGLTENVKNLVIEQNSHGRIR